MTKPTKQTEEQTLDEPIYENGKIVGRVKLEGGAAGDDKFVPIQKGGKVITGHLLLEGNAIREKRDGK